MTERERFDIYRMVNNVILQMDSAETPENTKLFEKIRGVLREMEQKIVTMANAYNDMKDAFHRFTEAYKSVEEEINYEYCKPKN